MKDIKRFVTYLQTLFHWQKTELMYNNEFQFVIAVLLSAQTTDKQVNRVTQNLFLHIHTPLDVIKHGREWIEKQIASIGLYKRKATHIIELSKKLIETYEGNIPRTIETLTTLPGIGIKSAKVIGCHLFDIPCIPVDTHVHRVSNRIGFVKTKTPEQTDALLETLFSENEKKQLCHAMVLFWRYYCKAKHPRCMECKINDMCDYFHTIF